MWLGSVWSIQWTSKLLCDPDQYEVFNEQVSYNVTRISMKCSMNKWVIMWPGSEWSIQWTSNL